MQRVLGEKEKTQSLFYITFNGLRIPCFIKSVLVTLVAYSELALPLLENNNASPPRMVSSAVVHVQRSVLSAGDPVSNGGKLRNIIQMGKQ